MINDVSQMEVSCSKNDTGYILSTCQNEINSGNGKRTSGISTLDPGECGRVMQSMIEEKS